MAEERISIHHCSNKCRYLREVKGGCDMVKEECMSNGTYCTAYIHGQWQKIDPEKDCKNCKRAEYDGISRTEAIERMAKGSAKYNDPVKQAEAALDALISLPQNTSK